MTLPAKMVPAHRKQLPNWQQTLARRLGPSGWLVVNRWVAGAKFHQANAELTRSLQEDPTCRSWPALKADNFHAQLTNLVFGTQHMCPWKALTSQDAAASCKDAEEKETYEAWYFDIVFNLLWIPLIFWYIPVFFMYSSCTNQILTSWSLSLFSALLGGVFGADEKRIWFSTPSLQAVEKCLCLAQKFLLEVVSAEHLFHETLITLSDIPRCIPWESHC